MKRKCDICGLEADEHWMFSYNTGSKMVWLCWERCNGIGTARWASEIEEFPIAVTQYWFEEGNEKWR